MLSKENPKEQAALIASCKLFTLGRPDGSSLVEPSAISDAVNSLHQQTAPLHRPVPVQESPGLLAGSPGIPGG